MFYSQFILAKKGPLGTIWIAAHLERKLRKNQVADTDIGVSVACGFGFVVFADPVVAERVVKDKHIIDGSDVEGKAVSTDDQTSC
uniref:Putative rad21/Rec8-like protein n=1 Tax=Helianthus annuus TaxID=4232 RepID=A0A251T7H8_HELAN